jgi:hypothetical protein
MVSIFVFKFVRVNATMQCYMSNLQKKRYVALLWQVVCSFLFLFCNCDSRRLVKIWFLFVLQESTKCWLRQEKKITYNFY